MVVLHGVELPRHFTPPYTDLVFLEVHGQCEVYMDAIVAYHGDDPSWLGVYMRGEAAGGSRPITTVPGDLHDAVETVQALIASAADGEWHQDDPLDRPLPLVDVPYVPEWDPGHPGPGSGRNVAHGLHNLVDESLRNPRKFVGRVELLEALKTNLIRESKPSVVLIGKPGVGKTAIAHMLAADIAHGRGIPPALADTAVL